MTPPEFIAKHPEFRNAGALIPFAIADAKTRTNSVVFGGAYEQAVALLAADILARSPYGLTMRLVDDKNETIYSKHLQRLRDERAVRMIVL